MTNTLKSVSKGRSIVGSMTVVTFVKVVDDTDAGMVVICVDRVWSRGSQSADSGLSSSCWHKMNGIGALLAGCLAEVHSRW